MLTRPAYRPPGAGDETTLREAARWVALAKKRRLSAREEQDLASWVERDPKRAAALELSMDAWSRAPQLLGGMGYAAKRGNRSTRPTRMIVWGATATACLALIGGYWLWTPAARTIAAADRAQLVTLADGSKIRLAPGGTIAVDFSSAARRVRLIRGVAEFDVAKAARPFIVGAGGIQVEVLGTAFTIELDQRHTTVNLKRGHIALKRGDERVADMYPGDRATYQPVSAHLDLLRSSPLARAKALPLGSAAYSSVASSVLQVEDGGAQLVATDLRLDRLASLLEVKTGRRIQLADGGVGAVKITGRIATDHIEDSLARAIAPHGMSLIPQGDTILIENTTADDPAGR